MGRGHNRCPLFTLDIVKLPSGAKPLRRKGLPSWAEGKLFCHCLTLPGRDSPSGGLGSLALFGPCLLVLYEPVVKESTQNPVK